MDNNIIINLSENIINDLSKFELIYNIKIFKKNNINKLILRNIIKVINDCNKIKKKKLLELSNELKILSNGIIDTEKIKFLQQNLVNDIDNLNSIINIITEANIQNNRINDDNLYNMNFIEIYSN